MIFLALDFGQKRLGLALCDESEKFVFPHTTHTRKSNDNHGDFAALLQIIRAKNVDALVLGIPGGSEQSEKTAFQARRFAENLRLEAQKSGRELPIFEQDERFSTALAAQSLQLGGVSQRQARENGLIDAASAAAFLETFLERRKRENQNPDTQTLDNDESESPDLADFSQ